VLQRLKDLFKPKVSANAGDFWKSELGRAVLKEKQQIQLMKKQIQLATEADTFKQGVPKSRSDLAFATAYETTLWVHVAIKAIAETASMLPIRVMETAADGSTSVVDDDSVFAVQVLNTPNPFDTPFEWKLNVFGSYGWILWLLRKRLHLRRS
jgi:phage portal protein BeeE